jgi:hypothetical protein
VCFVTVKLDTEGARTQNNPKQKPKKQCWNCGSSDHLLNSCPKINDLNNTAAKKVQYYDKSRFSDQNKAFKQVLFEICEQLEAEPGTVDKYQDGSVFFNGCQQDADEAEQSESGYTSANENDVVEPLFFKIFGYNELRVYNNIRKHSRYSQYNHKNHRGRRYQIHWCLY